MKICIEIGDLVAESPIGPGIVTSITDAGFPCVNEIAVARLTMADGGIFDPHGTYESDKLKLNRGKS